MKIDIDWVLDTMQAKRVVGQLRIQSLWGGYGDLLRLSLEGCQHATVVLKAISPPNAERGSFSHQRKVRSYQVEQAWYQQWRQHLNPEVCRVPELFGAHTNHKTQHLLLEDLDLAGFTERRGDVEGCLRWLAQFHGTFLGVAPEAIWQTGTYWHLETRPEELKAVRDKKLRRDALAIDMRLQRCRFKTFVHGDAKLANFCFGAEQIAAVDFQYVGGGCGMKDVAYLLSCLDERSLERRSAELLTLYFRALREARADWNEEKLNALESEWRELYAWAWADFMRFLAGWSPGYFQSCRYGQKMLREVQHCL